MSNTFNERIEISGFRPEAVEAIVDVLLMAIIRAHPKQNASKNSDRGRLVVAKTALFDIGRSKGPRKHDDVPELMYMAETYISERGEPEFGSDYTLHWPNKEDKSYSSETQLARKAMAARIKANPEHKYHDEEKKVRNLQQKFHKNIEDWLKITYNQGSLSTNVFQMKLCELEELFAPLGIKIDATANPFRTPNYPI